IAACGVALPSSTATYCDSRMGQSIAVPLDAERAARHARGRMLLRRAWMLLLVLSVGACHRGPARVNEAEAGWDRLLTALAARDDARVRAASTATAQGCEPLDTLVQRLGVDRPAALGTIAFRWRREGVTWRPRSRDRIDGFL